MTSHASVNVMLALEDALDIGFPEAMLRKATFESVAAIEAALIPAAVGDGDRRPAPAMPEMVEASRSRTSSPRAR